MGRNKLDLRKKEPKQQLPVYNKRINGFEKKGRELSILCDTPTLILSFTPKGKANLFLGPNTNFVGMINMFADMSPQERSNCKLAGIKALTKAFKGNRDHEIDVQQLTNLGPSRTSHAIQQGQQSSNNMTQEMQKTPNLCALIGNMSKDHLNHMEAGLKNLIQQHTKKKMEMSMLRARARASAVQHLTNQAEMNHPGLLNGNPVNHGTNLLQPNMVPTMINCPTNASNMLLELIEDDLKNFSLRNSGSNSDLDSDFPMAEHQEPFPNLDDIINRSDYDTHNFLAHEGGFGAWAPGN